MSSAQIELPVLKSLKGYMEKVNELIGNSKVLR